MWIGKKVLGVLLMTIQCLADAQPLANNDFLQKTMSKIQRERLGIKDDQSQPSQQPDPTLNIDIQEDAEPSSSYDIEQLSLSKDQLLALYQAALNTGSKLKVSDLPPFHPNHDDDSTVIQSTEQGQIPGYYYYFYPIKSFMNEIMKDAEASETKESKNKDKDKDMTGEGIPKTMEPLFTAMASFVGMAMMFIFTILFLPKLGVLKSRKMLIKEGSDEFITFTKILSESIQGNDCSQKIACHVGKTLRNMHMGTKSIKILELMLPQGLAKQLARIRRSAVKKEKCHYIKCKIVHNDRKVS